MASPAAPKFEEATRAKVPIRELGLRIAGTPLEPLLAQFGDELAAAGVRHLRPRYYLSSEWGVPFETISIAIPFYLAHPDLAELHADRTGMIEGSDPADVLRYLRHEMGHVVNYAYKLYDRPEWVGAFGAITQPYGDAYRPEPWSTRFVHHLPGWYAQKHPDEDWAETFAVWMTPGRAWRAEYASWPGALAKLELCERILREVGDAPPLVTDDELDEDIDEIDYSLDEFYAHPEPSPELPPGLDGSLRAIADEVAPGERPIGSILRRNARTLARAVYTWTGHFPEHTRLLVQHLAERADAMSLAIAESDEGPAVVALTALVTSLAMSHVQHGSYLP
jgi:hypothetical protein